MSFVEVQERGFQRGTSQVAVKYWDRSPVEESPGRRHSEVQNPKDKFRRKILK